MAVIFSVPVLDSHVLILRRIGHYAAPDPPSLIPGPFDCFVYRILNRYELELGLKRWR